MNQNEEMNQHKISEILGSKISGSSNKHGQIDSLEMPKAQNETEMTTEQKEEHERIKRILKVGKGCCETVNLAIEMCNGIYDHQLTIENLKEAVALSIKDGHEQAIVAMEMMSTAILWAKSEAEENSQDE